jgi:hypothetical protein
VQLEELLEHVYPMLTAPEAMLALYILAALIVGYVLGRVRAPRSSGVSTFQNRGEVMVTELLRANFGAPDYHLLNHVTLRLNDGTTQIDHILVSRFGVFVIETKDYSGWIFGDPKQPKWTQVLFWFRFRFQNPILQNNGHVRAVQDLLDFLPPSAVKSVVVFTGDAKFKTPMPPGVFYASEVVAYLRNAIDELMSRNRLQFCVGRLETARLAISGETDLEHIRHVRDRQAARDRRLVNHESSYL